jgi:two-component sensor histidine kinase
MGTYFEAGVGRAFRGKGIDLGRRAATQALSQLKQYKPSLAIVFACPELDLKEIDKGIMEVLKDCPVIGTSTAGEIANGPINRGVVVSVLASPHLRARVGMGEGVSKDFKGAVEKALNNAGVSRYFNPEQPLHQMLHISTSRKPHISPVLLIMFTPGGTKTQVSLSHDIHSMLRKASANRIPIFGGSSGDYFRFESNYQIFNNRIKSDAVVLAFIESELLFGMGMAHGFSPTTRRALITRASGHIVHELDGRPAAEVCADLLGLPRENLGNDAIWFSQFPFGITDLYGNSVLHVPEQILEDGSIKFGPLMSNDQIITLMSGTKEDVMEAGLSAYNKAILHGGLTKPALGLMFSCALRIRLMGQYKRAEVDSVYRKARIPIAGFYTFGEQGISDDGFPVYANQSVSTLVFSDELNPVAAVIHKGKRIYDQFTSQLNRKISEIKSITRINQVLEDQTNAEQLLITLSSELTKLLPWAHGAFYASTLKPDVYKLISSSKLDIFPENIIAGEVARDYSLIGLNRHGKHFGFMALKQKPDEPLPDEEDLVLAETFGKLIAGSLHKIELDQGLDFKMQQFEIMNQLGRELSQSVTGDIQFQNIVTHIRNILKFSMVSLWLVDPTHYLLVKEAIEADPNNAMDDVDRENDERITQWQLTNCQMLFVIDAGDRANPVELLLPFPYAFISLPVLYKGALRGILNIYSTIQTSKLLEHKQENGNIDFLRNIAAHIAMLIGNRFLQKDTTLFKEINHRVKNNLQNIASLLRMQIRRLDRISPEQALNDSISRIMSIAVVHETLSRGEIGMVNVGQLITSLSQLSLSSHAERPLITLDISGTPVMIPSKEATSLALVVNELIQNAMQHGVTEENVSKLSIGISQASGLISVAVQNDGPGLSPDFNIEHKSNLGLTIVRTLVQNELKGRFTLENKDGAVATVTFPLPETNFKA